jgi:hypothetical protein
VDQSALNAVKAAFLDAPASMVNNPDNSAGIKLHVEVDEQNLPSTTISSWAAFDGLKETHFMKVADRGRSDKTTLKKAWGRIFRYCLWSNNLTDGGGQGSGIGECPGDDFIVNENFVSSNYANAPSDARAGTFMHELGHNLGLKHDGGTAGGNYKPNYLSVMNYAYQAPFLDSEEAWYLDYSRNDLDDLNETSLSEITALVGPSYKSVMFNSAPVGATTIRTIVDADAGTADWNQDGNFLMGVTQDISRLHPTLPASPVAEQLLEGSIDWDHLHYPLTGSGNFEDGIGRDLSTIEVEMTEAEVQAMHTTVVVDLTNTCPADTDASGDVGIGDFLAVLAEWGTPNADVDGDGDTGIGDFLMILAEWGACP